MKQLIGDMLPLGSVVKLLNNEHEDILLYFIVARAITKNDEGQIVPRYKVAPHPYGDIPSQEVFSINVNDIDKIIFKGYEDQQDQQFLQDLLHQMENAKPITSQPAKKKAPQLTDEQHLKQDPFYKFK